MHEPFDPELRAQRRDRAARIGFESFLHQRVFDDCLERIALVQRAFGRALLIGCPVPQWVASLESVAGQVDVLDPGRSFAAAAQGEVLLEDQWDGLPAAYDLVLAAGTLDTVNDFPSALRAIRTAMHQDALLIGAMSGGDTLPQLRAAMRAADRASGAASPHVHPRIEAASVAPLLASAGFVMPVVDVDRISVGYRSLHRLVGDLRAMGATNVLRERTRQPLGKAAFAAASAAFSEASSDGRTIETFEVLHFAAWTAA